MSRTRAIMADLRDRLGASAPLAPPDPMPRIPPPPARVFPTRHERSRFAEQAARHTTALVGIGRVGTRYATGVVLQFQAELAVAHEAVATELPENWAADNGMLALQTRVTNHREFLLRPDLGRRLCDESLSTLAARADRQPDVQLILADGLSAVACMGSGKTLMAELKAACTARGWSVGTAMCAKFARVWLQDEIGECVGARVAVIILGERPGLGTGDGLSAYVVHGPRIGNTDGERNMMSNIHARGTPPARAAQRLALLIGAMLEQGTSGVDLDLSALEGMADLAGSSYRAPQVREQLLETN